MDKWNDYPDLIIIGGASGVDYLVERWANNQAIPMAIFTRSLNEPRGGLEDSGRPEAAPTLGDKMLEHATHLVTFRTKIKVDYDYDKSCTREKEYPQ